MMVSQALSFLLVLSPCVLAFESNAASASVAERVAEDARQWGAAVEMSESAATEAAKSQSAQLSEGEGTAADHVEVLLSSAQETMQHIGAIVGNQTWDQVSPEVQSSIEEMLKSITAAIQGAIISARDDYQQRIDSSFLALQTAANTAVNMKMTADSADQALVDCRGEERTALAKAGSEASEVAALRDDKVKFCGERDKARYLDWAIQDDSPLDGECNFKRDAVCQSHGVLAEDATSISRTISARRLEYKEKKKRCEDAMDALDKKLGGEAVSHITSQNFAAKRAECDNTQRQATTAICTFGDRLQEKCREQENIKTLIRASFDGMQTLSKEWATTNDISCMLKGFRDGGTFGEVDPECSNNIDFDRDVGSLDTKADDLVALTSGQHFTCEERTIVFSGERWQTGNTPDAYMKEASEVNIRISPLGSYPFDMCDPGIAGVSPQDEPAPLSSSLASVPTAHGTDAPAKVAATKGSDASPTKESKAKATPGAPAKVAAKS